MQLAETLLSLAALAATERGISDARLADIMMKDARFFQRLRAGGSCTVATFERLIADFRDPAMWHAERGIPAEARALLDRLPPHDGDPALGEVTASSGKAGDLTGPERVTPPLPLAQDAA